MSGHAEHLEGRVSDRASRKEYVDVGCLRMAYVEEGEGDPTVFLHGNPTSS